MENLKKQIIEESRHQFIFINNDDFRKTFLKNIAKSYPIKLETDNPIAIYLDAIGLPNLEVDEQNTDKIKVYSTCREYLSCLIVQNILENLKEEKILKNKIEKFLKIINRFFLNNNYPEIKSLQELISALKETRTIYYNYYIKYLSGEVINLDINSLKIPFLDINLFAKTIKEMLNNNSYFCIIADQQQPISIFSQQALNSLINMRINANLSIKVACNQDEWQTYYDLSGLHIDNIHDYAEIKIDEKKYIK